ncbi:hypothetical protein DB30_07031 [Enhygromyxa salina]|uniref:IgGFc-binding protein N-terminal domain-containing protein n=1 Tax=Enhygromyxa salina TaxID=215803 RepID=A0A0C1ZT04_9BACT|nr:IgGFc-binding protein [Enhygromyxa salina]KIG14173.1 hypothetical protein DB30_07031 [Enhygromyxa salina]
MINLIDMSTTLKILLPLALLGCVPAPAADGSGNAEDSTSEGACTPGGEDCECVGGECLGDLTCEDNICTACIDGQLGCGCVGGQCLGGLECVDDLCTDPDTEPTGDGDGDPTGDGDGDPTGDGDGDPTGDGDGDPTGDGDGDGDTCETATGPLGCEFYALKFPTDQVQIDDDLPLVIAIGNASMEVAQLEVSHRVNGVWVTLAGPVPVAGMSTHEFYFYGEESLLAPGHYDSKAFRVTSSRPVAAHQFNPGGPANIWARVSATNLIPVPAWGSMAETIGRDRGAWSPGYGFSVTAVATTDGTTLMVNPTDTVSAGPDTPMTDAPFQVLLDAGDVLSLFQASENEALLGTTFTSDPDHPIGLYISQSCGNAIADVCNDHYAEQLLPIDKSHGEVFIGLRDTANPPNQPQWTRWLLLPEQANTTVVMDSTDNVALPPQPYVISAPTLIGTYSVIYPQIGDVYFQGLSPLAMFNVVQSRGPSLVQFPPLQHLPSRYVFAIPDLNLETSLSLGYPTGSAPIITGTGETTVLFETHEFAEGWTVARYSLENGVLYIIENDQPFMAVVDGSLGNAGFSMNGGFVY